MSGSWWQEFGRNVGRKQEAGQHRHGVGDYRKLGEGQSKW